jgi:hypothetical protein
VPRPRAPHSQQAGFPLCSSRLTYHLPGFDAENMEIFDTSSNGSLSFTSYYPHLTFSQEGFFPDAHHNGY